jgi:hypothetical protein
MGALIWLTGVALSDGSSPVIAATIAFPVSSSIGELIKLAIVYSSIL